MDGPFKDWYDMQGDGIMDDDIGIPDMVVEQGLEPVPKSEDDPKLEAGPKSETTPKANDDTQESVQLGNSQDTPVDTEILQNGTDDTDVVNLKPHKSNDTVEDGHSNDTAPNIDIDENFDIVVETEMKDKHEFMFSTEPIVTTASSVDAVEGSGGSGDIDLPIFMPNSTAKSWTTLPKSSTSSQPQDSISPHHKPGTTLKSKPWTTPKSTPNSRSGMTSTYSNYSLVCISNIHEQRHD